MDFMFFVGFGFFCAVAIIVLQVYLKVRIRKKREVEYFRRMYWTMRKAQEDAKQDKNKKQ